MSEVREAFWVGALAMALAQAYKYLAEGNPERSREVIESALNRYTAGDRCEPKFARRLSRVWKPEDAYERAGS